MGNCNPAVPTRQGIEDANGRAPRLHTHARRSQSVTYMLTAARAQGSAHLVLYSLAMKHSYHLRDAELAVLCGGVIAVDGYVSRVVNDGHTPRTVVVADLPGGLASRASAAIAIGLVRTRARCWWLSGSGMAVSGAVGGARPPSPARLRVPRHRTGSRRSRRTPGRRRPPHGRRARADLHDLGPCTGGVL
jgi:hypothetical protein